MTYEERKRWLCQQCGKPHQCGYVNRGLEDDCTALQEKMEGWELGYQDATEEVQRLKEMFEGDPDAYKQGRKDATDNPTSGELLYVLNKGRKIGFQDAISKACEFFESRMWEMRAPDDNYIVVDGYAKSKKDFIEQFKKAMEEQQ